MEEEASSENTSFRPYEPEFSEAPNRSKVKPSKKRVRDELQLLSTDISPQDNDITSPPRQRRPPTEEERKELRRDLGPVLETIAVEKPLNDNLEGNPHFASIFLACESLQERVKDALGKAKHINDLLYEPRKLLNNAGGGGGGVKWYNHLLGLKSFYDAKNLVIGLSDENLNNKFINLSSALILFISSASQQVSLVFQDLVAKQKNPDLEAYVKYLYIRTPGSFAISQVPNPQLPQNLQNIKQFSLLRLSRVKDQLAKIFVIVIENLCSRRSYKNSIRCAFIEQAQDNQKIFKDKSFNYAPRKPSSVQAQQLSDTKRAEFLDQHLLKHHGQSEISSFASKEIGFDTSHVQSNFTHIFSPIKELTLAYPEHGHPLFFESAKAGCIMVDEGDLCIYDCVSNTTNHLKGETLTDLTPFLYLKNVDHPETRALWMQQIETKFYLNKTIADGSLKTQIVYRSWDVSKEPAQCETLSEEPSYTLQRKALYKNFTTSSFNHRSIVNDVMYYNLLSNCLIHNQSFMMEPLVITQHLQAEDDWSLYLKWEAVEAHPFLISLYGIANYLSLIASKGASTEYKKLFDHAGQDSDAQQLAMFFCPEGKDYSKF